MKAWNEDLLDSLANASGAPGLFERIAQAAFELGFEHCAYAVRLPLPFAEPRFLTIDNHDSRWRARYHEAGYIHVDPIVEHGVRSCRPVVWSDRVFAQAPALWSDAQSFGLRVGWSQSCFDPEGAVGVFSLARSREELSRRELGAKEPAMRWLVSVAHTVLGAALREGESTTFAPLSARERQVLRLTADGLTSGEIGKSLGISIDTANFHIKRVNRKLKVSNRTAAVARAAVLGLLR
ncbi:LuxR family transcriptional regulator [Variovorax saccharolyticus]|uniref:LuxR family transcriptional regulator n=1 Tax=Variovorax saccharolyticus TaxID=3053516 RepID=UPI002575D0F0|nr:LuxR family transcriptional regulator [Variovorax sp. J31P216]MDM0025726.1 LuxR family transcriptional regulator [Variovorax sp. J31P216]